MSKAIWYADGLRWIGAIFSEAADRMEANAEAIALLDPRVRRELEEHVDRVRARAHLHG